jgi:ribose transport system permease protein
MSEQASSGFEEAEVTLTEAVAQELEAPTEGSRQQRFWALVLSSRNAALTVVGIVMFLFFSLTTDTFLTSFNLLNTVRNISLIGIVAVGMTFLMVAGEIDVSVGSMFGFLTIILGVMVVRDGVNVWLGALIVIVLGTMMGMLNGLIRTKIGIPSLIVTLAMLSIYRSLALVVSEQQPWNPDGVGLFYEITGGYIGGTVPWLIVWMIVVMVIGGIVLSLTKFGYHVYATGGSLEAARNSGIDTNRVKLICFMLTGGLCGLAAPLLFGYLRVAAPITGTGFEFRVIGATIVGGIALTGGRGSIYGTFLGAAIIGMITNGLVLMGFSQHIGDVATGLLIMATGTLDLLVRRAASRSLAYMEG